MSQFISSVGVTAISPVSPVSPAPSREINTQNNKIIFILVGLPARGKSFIAVKIASVSSII